MVLGSSCSGIMSMHDGCQMVTAMKPVASGDSLRCDGLPLLVPYCEGRELQMDEDWIQGGMSAISMREMTPRCLAAAGARCSNTTPQTLKARNSFRCVHRPELRRVPGLRQLSPAELRTLFLELVRQQSPAPISPQTCADTGTAGVAVVTNVSSARSLSAGMRLHRARLFTAVLAAADPALAAPQGTSDDVDEAQDVSSTDEIIQDDEILIDERVQVILRPKVDEEPDASPTTA